MEIRNKQALYNEISMFKQNSPLTRAKVVFIGLLIITILMFGIVLCLDCYIDYLPDNIYKIASGINNDSIVIFSIIPFIMVLPLFVLENKINEIINNKVAKYLGKDIQANSQITPINFELLPNNAKASHLKKAMQIVTKINGKYPILNFRTKSKLSCVLSCSYSAIDYEVSILNVYWEKLRSRGKRTYVEDYGTDYLAIISIIGKEFNNEPTELLKENKIEYCGHEVSFENKIDILIIDRHKINVHGTLESKINLEIKLSEELIEKAIKLAENIIDNN